MTNKSRMNFFIKVLSINLFKLNKFLYCRLVCLLSIILRWWLILIICYCWESLDIWRFWKCFFTLILNLERFFDLLIYLSFTTDLTNMFNNSLHWRCVVEPLHLDSMNSLLTFVAFNRLNFCTVIDSINGRSNKCIDYNKSFFIYYGDLDRIITALHSTLKPTWDTCACGSRFQIGNTRRYMIHFTINGQVLGWFSINFVTFRFENIFHNKWSFAFVCNGNFNILFLNSFCKKPYAFASK